MELVNFPELRNAILSIKYRVRGDVSVYCYMAHAELICLGLEEIEQPIFWFHLFYHLSFLKNIFNAVRNFHSSFIEVSRKDKDRFIALEELVDKLIKKLKIFLDAAYDYKLEIFDTYQDDYGDYFKNKFREAFNINTSKLYNEHYSLESFHVLNELKDQTRKSFEEFLEEQRCYDERNSQLPKIKINDLSVTNLDEIIIEQNPFLIVKEIKHVPSGPSYTEYIKDKVKARPSIFAFYKNHSRKDYWNRPDRRSKRKFLEKAPFPIDRSAISSISLRKTYQSTKLNYIWNKAKINLFNVKVDPYCFISRDKVLCDLKFDQILQLSIYDIKCRQKNNLKRIIIPDSFLQLVSKGDPKMSSRYIVGFLYGRQKYGTIKVECCYFPPQKVEDEIWDIKNEELLQDMVSANSYLMAGCVIMYQNKSCVPDERALQFLLEGQRIYPHYVLLVTSVNSQLINPITLKQRCFYVVEEEAVVLMRRNYKIAKHVKIKSKMKLKCINLVKPEIDYIR